MCEADLEEEVSRTGKWGRNKISVTNGVKKDAVHWINAKKKVESRVPTGTQTQSIEPSHKITPWKTTK